MSLNRIIVHILHPGLPPVKGDEFTTYESAQEYINSLPPEVDVMLEVFARTPVERVEE